MPEINQKENMDDIHERILELIGEEKPFSWAKRIGIPKGKFNRIYNQKAAPSLDILEIIGEKCNISLDWLILGIGSKYKTDEFVFVPKAKTKLSGGPGAFTSEDFYPEKFAFRRDWLKRLTNSPSKVVLLEIIGDSMAPEIQDGDLVLVDMSRQEIRSGQIYAFAINIGDTAAAKVKRLYLDDEENLIIAVSKNEPEGRPKVREYRPDEIRILGRVIWLSREIIKNKLLS